MIAVAPAGGLQAFLQWVREAKPAAAGPVLALQAIQCLPSRKLREQLGVGLPLEHSSHSRAAAPQLAGKPADGVITAEDQLHLRWGERKTDVA